VASEPTRGFDAPAEGAVAGAGHGSGLRAKVLSKAGVKLRLNEKHDALDEDFERY
jgi:hypothetical protein